MTKKKNKSLAGGGLDNAQNPKPEALSKSPSTATSKPEEVTNKPSVAALIISRNKHWRYISSFHGPWLQLPPEVLETLANNNYALPRPRPIDPAIFFDLLKIRKLVDDATNLAVRAASGVTSFSLNNSVNAANGLMGNGGAALGLALGCGGGNAKLSRERKHRMRELASQKLSRAYHLDEIACSVATMQAASTLEIVAQLVLQRSPENPDAKYVHFFHEKIPSRQLAECTSLQPLDEVIAARPSEAELLRTRAVTKIFKEDYAGAAHDLTMGLQLCRYYQNQHKAGRQQLQLATEAAAEAQRNSKWREEIRIDEADHPSSLETQLLFHRAGIYLTIACQHINEALPHKGSKNVVNEISTGHTNGIKSPPTADQAGLSQVETHVQREGLEARKIVKTNAKRALRDYMAFLSHLEYTPGLPADVTEEFARKVNLAANSFTLPKTQEKSLNLESNNSLSNGHLSDALIAYPGAHNSKSHRKSSGSRATDVPILPSPRVYQISTLFSATPPSDLPPYPETAISLATRQQYQEAQKSAGQALLAQTDCHEALTYHPLLTDALHSLLLCHCLIQTSARELQRHAYMVARLARVCDGYPIFQAARSPSRADWIEVLRRSDSWISLSGSWECLCAPAPLPGQGSPNQQKETVSERKERLKQQYIMEALEDDRVHDEASFHAAVAARQRREEEESWKAEGRRIPKRWAQEHGKEYPISSLKASAIVRWIREAPLCVDATGTGRRKKGKAGERSKSAAIEKGMTGNNVQDSEADDVEAVEEEVD